MYDTGYIMGAERRPGFSDFEGEKKLKNSNRLQSYSTLRITTTYKTFFRNMY